MYSTFAIALLSAYATALRIDKAALEAPQVSVQAKPEHKIEDLPLDEELAAAEGTGYGQVGCLTNCDCSLDLGCGGLAAGLTCESSGGSLAYTAAHNEQIPDKLYCIDAVTCRDETVQANEQYDRNDLGNHTFSIEGSITISESFNQNSNNTRQGREQANGCAHKEQAIKLADNCPVAIAVPCVC